MKQYSFLVSIFVPIFIPIWNWLQWAFSGNRVIFLGTILLLGLLLGRIFGRFPFLSVRPSLVAESPQTEKIQVGEQLVVVELARTPAAIEQGLSDRSELGADGMLFILPRRSSPSFWMLRMQFGLDIIWLDTGEIVQIDSNVPPPSQTNGVPTVVSPRQPVTAVLEVPAGTAARFHWKQGTKWSFISPSTGLETVVQ